MMRVLLVNYAVPNCGVHQYAKNLFGALQESTKFEFVYCGISSQQDLDTLVRQSSCAAVLVNYHPQTLPFLSTAAPRRYEVPCIAVMHEMTGQEADEMRDGLFQAFVMGDPTLQSSNPRVYRTGRLIPRFENPYPSPAIVTIGSFGFSVGSKGFVRLVDAVQEEFDEAVIRLNIPANGIIDKDGEQARRSAERCRARVWKPGIRIDASHEFLDDAELLDFLARNTLNAFLYDYLPKAGISSAVDQAMTVRRPLAITRSIMFRHLFDVRPPITIEDTSLTQIIRNGIEPYRELLEEWAPERLRSRYEDILRDVLGSQGVRPTVSGAGSPRHFEEASKRIMENTIVMRILRGGRRRLERRIWRPGWYAVRQFSVWGRMAVGIKPRARYNRILDDTARIEYASVTRRLGDLAPEVIAKKIARANIQQAFVFDAVLHFAQRFSRPRILCVGSFEDSAAIALKKVGFQIEEIDPAVNGLDLSSFMKLPTTQRGSYDIVFSTSVLEHVKADEKFVTEIAELLAPGGIGVLTCDFKPNYRPGDPVIDGDWRFYTKDDLSHRIVSKLSGCTPVDAPAWDCSYPDFELGGFRYTFATLTFRKSEQPDISFDWSAMSPTDQARFYSENGFLVIPQALSSGEVRQAIAEVKQHGLKGTTEEVWNAPFARALVINPKLLSALKAIFGEQVRFFKAAYVETPPDDPRANATQRKALHVDYGIGEPEGDYRNSCASWVNVATYLTDLTSEHSPLWVCPGSNRSYGVVPASDMERFADRAKMVLARAGDMVLFHCTTVHAASHNHSTETRHALFYSYRPAWAKPVGQVSEWSVEFIDSFPPEHRALFRGLNRGI